MFFDPFEITTVHITYALLGAFIVLFGMFSLFLREKLYIGEAIWAFIFGIIIGPYAANIFNPRAWGNSSNPEEPIDVITLEFTRVVLAIGVFAIGVELPKAYMVRHWKSLFFLLVPGMIWGWFVCAGLIYALIPGLNFLSSLSISACLTPTDPILASAVVGGKWADKHVPAHIRHLLAAESACNDGAAFPFLFFALYFMTDLPNVGHALRDWFVVLWLYQVILGVVIGSLIGFSFRHLMIFCQRHDLIDRQSYVAQYLSLAILTIGICTLLGCDDLLAAFACGTSFAWDGFFNKQTEESVFSSVIDTLFNVVAFVFVGAWMPFGEFHVHVLQQQDGMGAVQVWRLVVLGILVLLLRRLPIIMGMYRWIPDVKTWREAVFTGHFGPMGIGAIFISTFAAQFLIDFIDDNPASSPASPSAEKQRRQIELVRRMIQPIVAFMVICSIMVHGLSISGFSLGRRVHTVSRTWSRRDTMNSARVALPDWMNQARVVIRGDDIVVNRDLERGDGGEGGEGEEKKDQSERPTPVPPTLALGRDDQTQFDDFRTEFPPDGRHGLPREWREGRKRVVESWKDGPGDDVETTVINDPSPSPTPSSSSRQHTTAAPPTPPPGGAGEHAMEENHHHHHHHHHSILRTRDDHEHHNVFKGFRLGLGRRLSAAAAAAHDDDGGGGTSARDADGSSGTAMRLSTNADNSQGVPAREEESWGSTDAGNDRGYPEEKEKGPGVSPEAAAAAEPEPETSTSRTVSTSVTLASADGIGLGIGERRRSSSSTRRQPPPPES